jgi:hypothetical protein
VPAPCSPAQLVKEEKVGFTIFTAEAHEGLPVLPIAGSIMPANTSANASTGTGTASTASLARDTADQPPQEQGPFSAAADSSPSAPGMHLVRKGERTLIVLGHETKGIPQMWRELGTPVTIPV